MKRVTAAREGAIGSDIDDLEVNEATRNEVTRSREEMRLSLYLGLTLRTREVSA